MVEFVVQSSIVGRSSRSESQDFFFVECKFRTLCDSFVDRDDVCNVGSFCRESQSGERFELGLCGDGLLSCSSWNSWCSESDINGSLEIDSLEPLLEIGGDEIVVWEVGEEDLDLISRNIVSVVQSCVVGDVNIRSRVASWHFFEDLEGDDLCEVKDGSVDLLVDVEQDGTVEVAVRVDFSQLWDLYCCLVDFERCDGDFCGLILRAEVVSEWKIDIDSAVSVEGDSNSIAKRGGCVDIRTDASCIESEMYSDVMIGAVGVGRHLCFDDGDSLAILIPDILAIFVHFVAVRWNNVSVDGDDGTEGSEGEWVGDVVLEDNGEVQSEGIESCRSQEVGDVDVEREGEVGDVDVGGGD